MWAAGVCVGAFLLLAAVFALDLVGGAPPLHEIAQISPG